MYIYTTLPNVYAHTKIQFDWPTGKGYRVSLTPCRGAILRLERVTWKAKKYLFYTFQPTLLLPQYTGGLLPPYIRQPY